MKLVPRAVCDFETRSACNLRACGVWKYSIHPSTEVLCLVWRLPHWEAGRTSVWHPAFPVLGISEVEDYTDVVEFMDWIKSGGLVEAHNWQFENAIWHNVLVPRFGWPKIPLSQFRCSAAKASAHALPRGLDDAARALHLKIRKDAEGSKVMLKVSKPRKSRKAEREKWVKDGVTPPSVLWHESKELFERLWAYCRQDVLAEEGVSEALDDLSETETQMFLMDGAVNQRGFQLDKDAVLCALELIANETEALNAELQVVTNGYIGKATQRDAMKVWFESEGLELLDTQAATLDETLKRTDLTPNARRGVELMRALGRSSTAKYQKMKDWAGEDWRVRGGLLYHGASTGRWSGAGVQPHNFPKGSAKDMEALWTLLKTGNREDISAASTGVMEALSSALRGAIVAAPGRQLYVADYAAIEARVLLWLAGDEAALNIFRNHQDIYCDMAESIYHYPCNKADNPKERGLGKIAILGLGYQMGPSNFAVTCDKAGVPIEEDFAQQVVTAYREKYWRVKQMWYDQEAAAIAAVQSRAPVTCGYVTWRYSNIPGRMPFLYCTLPSGRRLAYAEPQVKSKMMPWGKEKNVLSFMGVDSYTRQWKRQTTYGGSIVENITQAVARDLMAEAMLRCEASDIYDLILSVHDELIAEADLGRGSVHDFEQLMAQVPSWAEGCPVEAEGWVGPRYRK